MKNKSEKVEQGKALHEELAQLQTQVWMTGADPALFSEIEGDCAIVEVKAGRLEPR